MKNDYSYTNTNNWSTAWCMHGDNTNQPDIRDNRGSHVAEDEEMSETKKARIKRLITTAHVKYVASQPVGSELFWNLALNGIDCKTLYEEFSQLELNQIIDSYTGEKK